VIARFRQRACCYTGLVPYSPHPFEAEIKAKRLAHLVNWEYFAKGYEAAIKSSHCTSQHQFQSLGKSLSVKKAPDGCPSVFLNLVQMFFVTEALGIDFVNVFCAGWPRSEPSALRDDLDAANGLVVAWRAS
jgi:hypothetical protein